MSDRQAAVALSRARRIGGAPAPTPTPQVPQPRRPRFRRNARRAVRIHRGRLMVVVLAVMLASLVAVDAVIGVGGTHRSSAAEQRQAAVATAKAGSAALLSYDYRHLAADEAATLGYATGDFKTQYLQVMRTEIESKAPGEKTVVVGQVVSAGIEAFDRAGTQATVLVFAQQAITKTGQPTPTLYPLQLRIVLDQVGGRWLIAQVTQLS
jgi:Mce-associated membrane protein